MGLALGESCTSPLQCGSGFCAQAVCCDQACVGADMACDLPGSRGTCSMVSVAPAISSHAWAIVVLTLAAVGLLGLRRRTSG